MPTSIIHSKTIRSMLSRPAFRAACWAFLFCVPLSYAVLGGDLSQSRQDVRAHESSADIAATRVTTVARLIDKYQKSDPAKAVELGREAMALLRSSGGLASEIAGDVMHDKARAHLRLGEYDSTQVLAGQLQKISRKTADYGREADALNLSATVFAMRGDFANARPLFEKSLTLRRKAGDEKGVGNSLNNLGIVHMRRGELDVSLGYYMQALDVWESLGEREGLGRVLNNIGIIHQDLGEDEQALGFLQRALELRLLDGDSLGVAKALTNIGLIEARLGNDPTAYSHFTEALGIQARMGDRDGMALSLANRGELLMRGGDLKQAEKDIHRALVIERDLGDTRSVAFGLRALGAIAHQNGDAAGAIVHFSEALALAEKVGERLLIGEIQGHLASAYESTGDFQAALVAQKAHKVAQDSVFNANSQSVVAKLQTEYKTKEQRQEIELLRRERNIQFLILLGAIGSLIFAGVVAMQAISKYRFKNRALRELEDSHTRLKETQENLIRTEKMASLGRMTAGVAHEILNPLNFVNNFSELNSDLVSELKQQLDPIIGSQAQGGVAIDVLSTLEDLEYNSRTIVAHGNRADGIVRAMMEHTGVRQAERTTAPVNSIVGEYVRLAYHGFLAQNPDVDVAIEERYDQTVGDLELVSYELGRAIMNIANNAFEAAVEAVAQAKRTAPVVVVSTTKTREGVAICIADNGLGIDPAVADRVFEPFFTTKPTGTGTGLGLSLAYEIVTTGHGGELSAASRPGGGTVLRLDLPAETGQGGVTSRSRLSGKEISRTVPHGNVRESWRSRVVEAQ